MPGKRKFYPCSPKYNHPKRRQGAVTTPDILVTPPSILQTISGEDYLSGSYRGTRVNFSTPVTFSSYFPSIQLCGYPTEDVGLIWVGEIDRKGFTVFNSGSGTAKFRWCLIMTSVRDNMPAIAEPYIVSPKNGDLMKADLEGNYSVLVSEFEGNSDNTSPVGIDLQISTETNFSDSYTTSVAYECLNERITFNEELLPEFPESEEDEGEQQAEDINKYYLRVRYHGLKTTSDESIELTSQWSDPIMVTLS